MKIFLRLNLIILLLTIGIFINQTFAKEEGTGPGNACLPKENKTGATKKQIKKYLKEIIKKTYLNKKRRNSSAGRLQRSSKGNEGTESTVYQDIIKRDQNYIYYIHLGDLYIFEYFNKDVSRQRPILLGRYVLKDVVVEKKRYRIYPDGLLFFKKKLVIISSLYSVKRGLSQMVMLSVLNIENPKNIQVEKQILIPGKLGSIKLLNSKLFITSMIKFDPYNLISSKKINFDLKHYWPIEKIEREEERVLLELDKILKDKPIEEKIVKWWEKHKIFLHKKGKPVKRYPFITIDDLYIPVKQEKGFYNLEMVNLVEIDLEDEALARPFVLTFPGGGKVTYFSKKALYILSSKEYIKKESDRFKVARISHIYRYALNSGGKNKFKIAEITVQGKVRNSSFIKAHDYQKGEVLYLNTNSWGSNFVTIEIVNDLMEVVNIQKKWTPYTINRVQFVGKKCFIETNKTGILYLFDLTNPLRPTLHAKLKTKGKAAYLKKIKDDFLVSVELDYDTAMVEDYPRVDRIYLQLFDLKHGDTLEAIHTLEIVKDLNVDRVIHDRHIELSKLAPYVFRVNKNGGFLAIPLSFAGERQALKLFKKFSGYAIYHVDLKEGIHLVGINDHSDYTKKLKLRLNAGDILYSDANVFSMSILSLPYRGFFSSHNDNKKIPFYSFSKMGGMLKDMIVKENGKYRLINSAGIYLGPFSESYRMQADLVNAIIFKQFNKALKLIKKSKEINLQVSEKKITPLMALCRIEFSKNSQGLFELLLQKNAKFEIKNNYGNTALHIAARSGNLEMAKRLIKHGANIKALNMSHETVLICAVKSKNIKLIKYLLTLNIDINHKSTNVLSNTALGYAKAMRASEIIKILKANGAID